MPTSACHRHSIHVRRVSCNQVAVTILFCETYQFIDDYMLRRAKPLQAFVMLTSQSAILANKHVYALRAHYAMMLALLACMQL